MKNIKKILAFALLLCLAITAMVAMSSCGGSASEHEHKLTEVAEIPATCTEGGTEGYYTCSDCDKLFSDAEGSVEIEAPKSIGKLGHSFTKYASNNDATCTADGTKSAKCDRCDETDTRADADSKLGHDHSSAWTFDADGHWHVCANEGCEVTDTKQDHTFGEWNTTKPATETEQGSKERSCSACGYVETEVIPELGHTHTASTVWEYNSTHHWNDCVSNDGQEYNKAEHSFVNNCDTTCDCGYERTIEHNFTGALTYDADGHWHICLTEGCEVTDTKADHVFDNACDTDCACGYTRTVSHDFSGNYVNDENQHWHVCTTEGCDVTDTKADHIFDNACDIDCACGYTRTVSHDFSGNYVNDENQHWHVCATEGCDVTDTKADHDYDNASDTDCACGYTRTVSHDFSGEWQKDADGHWHVCKTENCGATETKADHTFGEWNETKPATETEQGSKERSCSACGYVETEVIPELDHTHTASTVWEYNSTHHWNDCVSNDGQEYNKAEHSFDNNCDATCDCGYERTIEHNFTGDFTYDADGHWHICLTEGCEVTDTKADHAYDQENTKLEGALKTGANCENAAVYYKSCSCGAISDTETFVSGSSLGHNYGEASYAWSDDNSTCTATRACANDESHVETETVNASSVTTDATCEEDGKTVYTATFTNAAFAVQTKEVTIDATGHDYYESAVTAPTCTVVGSRTYTCKNNSEHTYNEEIAIDPTAHTNVNPKDDNCDSCGANLAYTFLVKDNNNNPFAAENGGSAKDDSSDLTTDKYRLNKATDVYENTYGSTFTFRVYVNEATTVDFYLFESNKNGATKASTAITKLTLNGNEVTVLDTAIPQTTDWDESTAQYIHVATLNLEKGENEITFVRNTATGQTNNINIRGIKLVSNIEVKLDKVNVYEFSMPNNNPFIAENGGSRVDKTSPTGEDTSNSYGNGGGSELTVTLWVEKDTVVTFRLISAWRTDRYFGYYKNLKNEGSNSSNYYNPNISYLTVNGETVGVTPSTMSYSSQGWSTYAHCELATIELKAGVANVISFKLNDTKGNKGTGDNVNYKGISIVSDVEVKIGANSQ